MRYTGNRYIQKKVLTVFAGVLTLAFAFSGCSSSSSPAATTTPSTTVTVGGTVTTESVTPEPNVTVTGKYSDTDMTPAATTDSAGKYSLTISNSKAVWLNFAKAGLATLNSEKSTLTTNITDADIDMPTTVQAQQLIDALFGAGNPLGNVAWLVVDVEDASANKLAGVSFSSIPAADAEVYVACGNIDNGDTATVAPCAPGDQDVMYIAFFTGFPVDASVSATGAGISDTKTAPLRQGEITFIDFD
jgi:hypothetical protein